MIHVSIVVDEAGGPVDSEKADSESTFKSKEKRKRRTKGNRKKNLKLKKMSLNLKRDGSKALKRENRLA